VPGRQREGDRVRAPRCAGDRHGPHRELRDDPPASVCGLYFGHREARYFTLGKIDKDQVEDYARRRGASVADVEKWIAANLGY